MLRGRGETECGGGSPDPRAGQFNRAQDRAPGAAPWVGLGPTAHLRWAQRSRAKLTLPHFQSPLLGSTLPHSRVTTDYSTILDSKSVLKARTCRKIEKFSPQASN